MAKMIFRQPGQEIKRADVKSKAHKYKRLFIVGLVIKTVLLSILIVERL